MGWFRLNLAEELKAVSLHSDSTSDILDRGMFSTFCPCVQLNLGRGLTETNIYMPHFSDAFFL